MIYRHADVLRLVIQAIRDASPADADCEIAADHCLCEDFAMDGAAILRIFELLEEELGLRLWPALALDFVRAGPSVGRLARLIAEQLHAQAETVEAHHAA